MTATRFFAAVDIGAGLGAKLGIFDERLDPVAEGMLPTERYGGSADNMAKALADAITDIAAGRTIDTVGLVSPGLFRSDGSALIVANVPFLTGQNLPAALARTMGVTVRMANDADAGGLAEWSLVRREHLYWVLGGGWGGAWVAGDGTILFPSLDWDRNDASLHHTNEPGYSIPLPKARLREIFARAGASWDVFEDLAAAELSPPGGRITGPSGNPETVRAELVVSGPGRFRLFRAMTASDNSHLGHISEDERKALSSSATAGIVINRLHELGVEPAVKTDMLFAEAMAEAAAVLLTSGCPVNIEAHLAGGPSRALPFFGPHLDKALASRGLGLRVVLAKLEAEGRNANLLGAAVLASGAARNLPTCAGG